MTAADLRALMIKELGEDNPKEIPAPLDRMLGYTFAFRVKVQPKYNNSIVIKMSDDKDLMKIIMDRLGADEATSESDKPIQTINLDSQNEVKCDSVKSFLAVNLSPQNEPSLSGTADHDPEFGNAVTPAKRQPSELASDDNLTQDLASTQLSSTKLSKHIKTE